MGLKSWGFRICLDLNFPFAHISDPVYSTKPYDHVPDWYEGYELGNGGFRWENISRGLAPSNVLCVMDTVPCSAPSEKDMKRGAFHCPNHDIELCLNGNLPIDSLDEAWLQCSEMEECTKIMKSLDGKFYFAEERAILIHFLGRLTLHSTASRFLSREQIK